MKSEQETKKFIDSKEALTFKELQKFIKGTSGGASKLERRMWDYVMATKDCKILREYKLKIRTHNVELSFSEFKKIYNGDERFRIYGRVKIQRLLSEQYKKTVGGTTTTNYLQRIRGRKYEVCA